MYEQKFLDVRSKLLKKRREIYGERSASGANPFDNQLSAADAMANSILSKFGAGSGNGGNSGGNGGNRNDNYGGNRGGGGGSSNGNSGGSDLLNNEL